MVRKKIAKVSALLLTVALAASTFVGCGNKQSATKTVDSSKQVIRFCIGGDPKTIDPGLASDIPSSSVALNCFDGLTRNQDNPVPAVAEKWDISPDGLTYTFHLRSGVKWSDGQPVKASDFEYAWKRALAPETASDYAYQLFYLKNGEAYNNSTSKDANVKKATADEVGVKAKDDSTLVVTLEAPTSYFLNLCASQTYMPVRKDIVDKYKDAWATKPESYICDGPFKITQWKMKDKIIMEKNTNYWNAKDIKPSRLEMSLIEQDTSYFAAYQTGQLDFIQQPPSEQLAGLIKKGEGKIAPNLGTYYYAINVSDKAKAVDPAAYKALSNPKVRQALNLAIDRKKIVEDVAKGGQTPATSFVPKGIPEGKKDFHQKEYFPASGDVAKAKQLLADAGYPDGKGFPTIKFIYNTLSLHQNVAQAVQEMWRTNLGINMTLQNEEFKVVITDRNNKNFVMARDGWSADYADPMTFLDLLTSNSGNNDPGYTNPDYDKLIASAKAESNPEKRFALLHQAEDKIMDDMPVIPIFYYTTPVAQKTNIKDVYVSVLGPFYFDHAYVEAK